MNGKQLNFKDPRSKLFFEFVRIKEEVDPEYFLLENVKMAKASEKVITDILEVEPLDINSNLFVPQNRRRLYWTNIPVAPLPEVDPYMTLSKILLKREECEDITERAFSKQYGTQAFSNVLKFLRTPNEKARCLMASGQSISNHGATNILVNGRLYKMHPTEAERLQGLPDGYTEGVLDSHRFKALGNGWTVPVIAHIFKGIETFY